MVPVGGVAVMLLGVVVSGVLCLLVYLVARGPLGVLGAGALALLLWSLAVIACLTLVPAEGAPGIVPAETRQETCSWDYGGPAPEGFWIFSGGQRLLNTLVFVPPGLLMVVFLARWPRAALVTVPLGLAVLAAYSAGIELTQLELARLDRACDITDVVDNSTGALLGGAAGLLAALVLRPWRARLR
ncbi:VanZ family protein [Nocardioides pantholopis]|uniref:VanZ family protein n=1 Tax=Nocardioides pantholopis TaxID=2483798 RepID=UPI0013DDC34C|nr:VanZ family protein [Nocardioides pantholopis]